MSKVMKKGQVEKKVKADLEKKKVVVEEPLSDDDNSSEEEAPKKVAVATKKNAKVQEKVAQKQNKAKKQVSESEDSEDEKPAVESELEEKKMESDDSAEQKPAETKKSAGEKNVNEVIVKGLSYSSTEEDIENLFEEKAGTVVRVNLLKSDGRSKGLAFVGFESEEVLLKALELNETEFMGRTIVVDRTKPKGDRAERGDRAGKTVDEESTTIFVGNLSYSTDQDDLKEFFSSCGKVVDARVAQADGKSRGFAHVQFEDRSGVNNAMKKAGQEIDGRPIKVDVAAGKREGGRPQGGFNNRNGGGFNKGGFNKGGFNKGGFNKGGFNKGGHGGNRGGPRNGGFRK